MEAVTEILHKIRKMDDVSLLERFNHLTRVQAIKEYLADKIDNKLNVEVRLSREEVLKRMSERESTTWKTAV